MTVMMCDECSIPHASWSTRVPCPGGSAASNVGWAVRETPISAFASGGFTSEGLGSPGSGVFAGADAGILEILIGTSFSVVPDPDELPTNVL